MNCCDEYGKCQQGNDCPVRIEGVEPRPPYQSIEVEVSKFDSFLLKIQELHPLYHLAMFLGTGLLIWTEYHLFKTSISYGLYILFMCLMFAALLRKWSRTAQELCNKILEGQPEGSYIDVNYITNK